MRTLRSLLLVTSVAATAFAADPSQPSKAPQPPAHPKVIIIGMDGASLNVLDPLIEAGVVPNLAKIRKTAAAPFDSIWPLRTPQVWTTIATGKYPGQHHIWDHFSDTRYSPPPFRTREHKRLSSKDRHAKALWNILDARGLSTMTVGWIESWPAEKLQHGIMAAPPVLLNPKKQVSIKGTFWRDQPDEISPKKLWDKMKPLIVEGTDLSDADVKAFADVPPPDSPLYKLPYLKSYMRTLKWSVARARSVEAITEGLLPAEQPDLLMAYFQCSDSLSHRFWIFQKTVPEIQERLSTHDIPTGDAEELHKRFGHVVQSCWEDIDARIGRILAKADGDNTLVLIMSDHGFGEAPFPHPDKNEPYGGNHRDQGLLLASAPWLKPGTTIDKPGVLDIAPTLLHLFGQPVGKDMPGKGLTQLLDPASAKRPVQRIASYEKKPQMEIPFKHGWPARKFRPLAADR